jgi:hypothetical protein
VVELLGSDGPAHPDEWDGRVADLAAFVEDERGLDFDHPVYVDFLSAAEYSAQTTEEDVSLADGEREELDRYAGQLRALGVASGELDLFTAFNQVADGGTLAFYDPTDQRVRVRGTEMTGGSRSPSSTSSRMPCRTSTSIWTACTPRISTAAGRRRSGAWPKVTPSGSRTPTSPRSSPPPSRRPTTRSTQASWRAARRPPPTYRRS